MEKYLLTIEFRYYEIPKTEIHSSYKSKTVTIGIYNSFEDACLNGNLLLEKLESKFPKHIFLNGTTSPNNRFSKNGGCFGSKNTLVTNLAYLKTPFDFYCKIETLNFDDIDKTIDDVVKAVEEYKTKN